MIENAQYQVVYDITQQFYPGWFFPLLGLFLLIVATCFIYFERHEDSPSNEKWYEQAKPYAFFLFSAVFFLIGLYGYRNFRSLRNETARGNYQVIEGQVQNYLEKGDRESFTVNGHRFAYSYNVTDAGYNITNFHGGVIREGLRVRIAYIGNAIVKLEIEK